MDITGEKKPTCFWFTPEVHENSEFKTFAMDRMGEIYSFETKLKRRRQEMYSFLNALVNFFDRNFDTEKKLLELQKKLTQQEQLITQKDQTIRQLQGNQRDA
jgi:septal ring factor EnvC (AmiA/AmiB activator)